MSTLLGRLGRWKSGIALAVVLGAYGPAAGAAEPEVEKSNPPARPAETASTPVKGILDRNHLLGKGDTIEIIVDGYPQFSRTVKLFNDGTFDYPILGTVKAGGLTVAELKDRLTDGFRKELRRPVIYVNLVDVYIPPPVPPPPVPTFVALGAISRKGEIPIPEPKPLRRVLEELNPSGAADLTSVRIKYPDNTVRYIDASTFARTGMIKDDILIKGGEEIILVEKPTPPPTPKIRVQVLGHVTKAGSDFLLEGTVPILDVINQAGGPKPGAAMDRVKVRNGGQERIVNVERYRSGDVDANYFCKDGDVILIEQKPMTVIVFGEVSRPGDIAVDKDQTLADLVLQAGVTASANRSAVELIRRDEAGKVTRKRVNVIDIQRQKKEDVQLVDGDVLFVPPKVRKRGIVDYLSAIASPLWLLRSIAPGGPF